MEFFAHYDVKLKSKKNKKAAKKQTQDEEKDFFAELERASDREDGEDGGEDTQDFDAGVFDM